MHCIVCLGKQGRVRVKVRVGVAVGVWVNARCRLKDRDMDKVAVRVIAKLGHPGDRACILGM